MSNPTRSTARLVSPLFVVLLIGVVLVIAEIALFVWVAEQLGWWTLVLVAVTTIVGMALLQAQWRKSWQDLSRAMSNGVMPAGQAADPILVLAGGILLFTPGFITDLLGFLLLIPVTRSGFRAIVGWWARRGLGGGKPTQHPDVISGEIVEEDPQSGPQAIIIREIED